MVCPHPHPPQSKTLRARGVEAIRADVMDCAGRAQRRRRFRRATLHRPPKSVWCAQQRRSAAVVQKTSRSRGQRFGCAQQRRRARRSPKHFAFARANGIRQRHGLHRRAQRRRRFSQGDTPPTPQERLVRATAAEGRRSPNHFAFAKANGSHASVMDYASSDIFPPPSLRADLSRRSRKKAAWTCGGLINHKYPHP